MEEDNRKHLVIPKILHQLAPDKKRLASCLETLSLFLEKTHQTLNGDLKNGVMLEWIYI
jgi:hypothetical protein